MQEIRAFEKENSISFLKRKHLILFVSKYLAFEYQKQLELMKATAMDDYDELKSWEEWVEKEVPEFKKALYKVLNFITFVLARRLTITSKSLTLKIAFKLAKIKRNPINCFPENVVYRIDELDFEKIVNPNY